MRPYRDEFIEFCLLHADNSPGDSEAYADVHGFLERLLALCHPVEAQNRWSEWHFDAQHFTNREFVLYLLATLTQRRQCKVAARLMDDRYQFAELHSMQSRTRTLSAFDEYPRSLDEVRKNRLELRPVSVSGDMVREWATHPRITFRDLIHTDLVLAIRGPMTDASNGHNWWPRLLPYTESVGPIDVLAKATTSPGLTAVRDLFGAKSLPELAVQVARALASDRLSGIAKSPDVWLRGRIFERLLNWDELRHHLPSPR